MDLSRAASAVSAVTRLPLMAVPLFFVVGAAAGGVRGLLWAAICVSLTSGLSLVYLAYLTRSGRIRDPRGITREERVGPLRVVAALHAGGFLVVLVVGAPDTLQAVLCSYALATLLFALLAPVVNLSLHTGGVSGAAVCLTFVFGAWGAVSFVVVPLVWWARATLGRHTSLELALGVLAGGGGTWFAFVWLASG